MHRGKLLAILIGILGILTNVNGNDKDKNSTNPNSTDSGRNLKIVQNVTRQIPTFLMEEIDGEFTACPPNNWVNGIILSFGTNKNLVGIAIKCRKTREGGGTLVPSSSEVSGKPEQLCESSIGSFGIGILANLRNRNQSYYSMYMAEDVQLVCGGKAEITNSSYNWRLVCSEGLAMCGVQTRAQKFDSEQYINGLTISCCEVKPITWVYSASLLVYVNVYGGPDLANSTVCIGGDFVHRMIKISDEFVFECATLITKHNKYKLLDFNKDDDSTGDSGISKTCTDANIMIGICQGSQIEYQQEMFRGKAEAEVEKFKEFCRKNKITVLKEEFWTNLTNSILKNLTTGNNNTIYNPICRPNGAFISSSGDPFNTRHIVKKKSKLCPPGHGMCGAAQNNRGLTIICCRVVFGLCESNDAPEQLSTEHCNVVNSDSVCTIEYKIGDESTDTESIEEMVKRTIKAGVSAEAEVKGELKAAASAKLKAKASIKLEANASVTAAASFKVEAEAKGELQGALKLKNIAAQKLETRRRRLEKSKEAAEKAKKELDEFQNKLSSKGNGDPKKGMTMTEKVEYTRLIAKAMATAESEVRAEVRANSAENELALLEAELQARTVAAQNAKAAAEVALDAEVKASADVDAAAKASLEASASAKAKVGAGYESEQSSLSKSFKSDKLSVSRTVSSTFHVRKGGKLVAFQKVSTCGGVKSRSAEIANFVVPTNICEATEELLEVRRTGPIVYSREDWMTGWHTNLSLFGLGLHWNKRPDNLVEEYGYDFKKLKGNLPDNFINNVELTPSYATGFDWYKTDEEDSEENIWIEYAPFLRWKNATVKVTTRKTKFYRLIGKCGEDWTIAVEHIVAIPYGDDSNHTSETTETPVLTTQLNAV